MDKEFLEKHDRSRLQCRVNALKAVGRMDLPKTVVLSNESFSGLGPKTTSTASKILQKLVQQYGDSLPYLIGLSLHEIWYSLYDGSGYIALMMGEGAMGGGDYMERLATAEGYGEIEGIAWALYNHMSDLSSNKETATFLEGTPFESRPSQESILTGAAMYWFAAAATAHQADDTEGAFDLLSEAQEALSLANGNRMWDEGAKLERESAIKNSDDAITAARTALAKAAAQARHSETRGMKENVFKWLDSEMENFKSMDAAAQAIIKREPIAFRTARDWVGDWKKLRSAGTP